MPENAYFTICSRNYLAYALTLYHSLKRADPDAAFYCFLVDRPEGTEKLPFPVVVCEDIEIPGFWDMAMRYSVMELNTAVKPFCIDHLFDRVGASRVFYLDPDLYILRPFTHVHAQLDKGADIVLTPHALAPLNDGGDPDDVRLMRTGSYNLGFGAFANTPSSRALVAWWGEQLRTKCVVDLEGGLFVDQKFMDLAPSYVDNAAILRHPGYNVAYWNLPHRTVTAENGWSVNSEALHFFHFSGVVPGDKSVFSKHQDRYTAADIGALRPLLDEYLDALAENGHSEWSQYPYAYNYYNDGSAIADPVRKVYARKTPEPGAGGRDLFDADHSLANAISTEGARHGCRVPLTNVIYQVWKDRPDLQTAFDINSDAARMGLLNWFVSSGERELGLGEPLLARARGIITRHGGGGGGGTGGVAGLRGQVSRTVLHRASALRPLYRRVPASVRERIVQVLLREGYATAPGLDRRLSPPDPSAAPVEGVNMFGYFRTESGVGQGARLAYGALKAAGETVSPVTLKTVSFRDGLDDIAPGEDEPPARRINLFHLNADQMMVLPRWVSDAYHQQSYNIGYWAWELETFPEAWQPALERVDEVWVPSRFVQESVSRVTDKPVIVIPHPVIDQRPDDEAVTALRQRLGISPETFMVLTAFDLNSFIERKNPFGAIAAFREAFGPQDDACLVLKYHGSPDQARQRRELRAHAGDDPRIVLTDEVIDKDEMLALQAACNAFLSLHRSEGFGLNLAECMLKERPVIATDWSGNTDFMTPDNSLPVPHAMKPIAKDEYIFGQGQHWADPDIADAAAKLKALKQDPEMAQRIGAAARQTILAGYSPEAIGQRMSARLAEIRKKLT